MAFRLLLILVAGVALVTILTHYGSDSSERGRYRALGGVDGGVSFASTAEGFAVPRNSMAYLPDKEPAASERGKVYAAEETIDTERAAPIQDGELIDDGELGPRDLLTPDQLLPRGDNPFGDSLGSPPDVMGAYLRDPLSSEATRKKGPPMYDIRGEVPLKDGTKHSFVFNNSPYDTKTQCKLLEVASAPGAC